MHLWWRIILFFSVFSLGAQLVFGFDHLQSLWTIYRASSPHVAAFTRGVTNYQGIDTLLLVVGFLYRRGIRLLVTKTITWIGIVVMPYRIRQKLGDLLEFPKEFMMGILVRVNMLYVVRWGDAVAHWMVALQYSLILFAVVFVALEVIVALLQGVLLLPPIVLQYKVQILTGLGSLALGTFAQAFLLAVWNQFCKFLPDWFWDYIYYYKTYSFRRAVMIRRKLAKLRHRHHSGKEKEP
jgi:hypothetical protein